VDKWRENGKLPLGLLMPPAPPDKETAEITTRLRVGDVGVWLDQ